MSNAEKMRLGEKPWALVLRKINESHLSDLYIAGTAYESELHRIADLEKVVYPNLDGGESSQEWIEVGGRRKITEIDDTDSPYTINIFDDLILVDTSTAAVTIVLSTEWIGRKKPVIIKDKGNAGSNNITVNTEAAETIDGAGNDTISTNYGSQQYSPDGTNVFKT